MNPIPSLIEEMAKALAYSTYPHIDGRPTRWPTDADDRIPGRDGSVPFDWDFAVACREKAQAIVNHLSTFETFGEDETATELDRAAFDIDCGLTYPSTPMTFALRRAVNGMGADDFLSAGYQWTDKPHRLVYDACGEIERQAHVIAEQKMALVKCLALIDDMSRFVGSMALKDYALFNEAPALARLLTREPETEPVE